jgi:hypothetical protein
MLRLSDIAHFWSKVDKSGDCWEWLAGRMGDGYAQFRVKPGVMRGYSIKGTPMYGHHVSYRLHYGPIPSGAWVCHRCDVRHCVRPGHLFLTDRAGNARDRKEKGRASRRCGDPPLPARTPVPLSLVEAAESCILPILEVRVDDLVDGASEAVA